MKQRAGWLSLLLVACGATPAAHEAPLPASSASAATVDAVDGPTAMMRDLAALRFDRLGNPVLRWDQIPSPRAPASRPHRLLVVLVDFQDRKFDRFAGEADQGSKLASWYQDLLFDDSYKKPNTLSHYYLDQSLGGYHLTGKVLPPVTLSKGRAAYGAPLRPAGGSWRNDSDPEGMVEEALALVGKHHADLPWAEYDRWDPKDFDGDGELDEADGYLDHFVLVYAGGGQSSCNLLYKLDRRFTPNAGSEALEGLSDRERECAERMWPHRFMVQRREGQGPEVAARPNPQGGAPIRPGLWARDYNMQSEYTGVSTFVHEFAHSLGLPDVYARTSSNSTGSWEVMSATASHSPQSLSSWSRMQLGWLTPRVVIPPALDGPRELTTYLRTLDEPAAPGGQGSSPEADRALLVVLPPKQVDVDLGGLPASSGAAALYSGQGNELNRSLSLKLNLTDAGAGAFDLSFDAWWEIEGGWDFAYLETSIDEGRSWKRRVPRDRHHMPAKHGHDGSDSLPGFTGLSGDLDGDNKNESNPACDPKAELLHGDDKAGQAKSPCLEPSWVRPSFDLADLRGHQAIVRLRYFTDMAAVMRGIMIDNLRVSGLPPDRQIDESFEGELGPSWRLDGFSKSGGRHQLLVPHYYMIEYRDPYGPENGRARYDASMDEPFYRFYRHPADGRMMAVRVRPRPGVLVWYFNGDYAWSENDPADNGPGRGYLLAVDSNPNELKLVGFDGWLRGNEESHNTHYELDGDAAQAALGSSYAETMCFVRNPSYLPSDEGPLPKGCGKGEAPAAKLKVDGRPLMFSYQIANELLPGPAQDAWQPVGELLDQRTRKAATSYVLRPRSIRFMHNLDAPFALDPFPDGLTFYVAANDELEAVGSVPHPARARFSDLEQGRWLNPKLPFGGVDVPRTGFSFELAKPDPSAPKGAKVALRLSWQQLPRPPAPAEPASP